MKIKRLTETAQIPTRATSGAAGYDLYADINSAKAILPHTTAKIGTGIAIELPKNTFGAVFARSSLASKRGLRPANAVGAIDEDYRGQVFIPLHNDTDQIQTISPGERIAQLIIMPYQTVTFEEVDNLDETVRGEGGFGSSGR